MLHFYWLDLKDFFRNKLDYSAIFHRLCCLFSGLIVAYCLLRCVVCFSGARDDWELFSALGTEYTFGHYLIENSFPEAVQEFLPIFAEFLLYLILYRRAERKKHPGTAAWYFGLMVLLHVLLFAHAVSLDFPEVPPYVTAAWISRIYYLFARTTLAQSVFYLAAYLLHIRDVRYVTK